MATFKVILLMFLLAFTAQAQKPLTLKKFVGHWQEYQDSCSTKMIPIISIWTVYSSYEDARDSLGKTLYTRECQNPDTTGWEPTPTNFHGFMKFLIKKEKDNGNL